MNNKSKLSVSTLTVNHILWPIIGAVLFFFIVCLCSAATVRATAMLLILLTLSAAFLYWNRLRDRLSPPILALGMVVLMDVLSCAYAVSGKFALNELLKVLAAFCLALLILVLVGEEKPERTAATVLEGFAAVAGLTSIDLLSTHWISTPVLSVLNCFTSAYSNVAAVEEGVRMRSVFQTPNTFAACVGIGVLLSLGLTASAKKAGERAFHTSCLLVNALSFVLTFSMGACAAIGPAFLILLILTGKEHRAGMLILMVETLIITVLAAFPISVTAMTVWDGFRPIPLACTAAGAAALYLLDLSIGRRLSAKLARHGKTLLILTAGLLAGMALFVIIACKLTTGITIQAGETLRRSAYPLPGAYTMTAETDGDLSVVIESQNRENTIMHTYTQLYQGPLSQASFTVPEDSLVVWFLFSADGETRLEAVEYSGEIGSGSIPLDYRLLPGFVANRLQGFWANQNAIQRFAFFEDGLKLFCRSPVIGLGLGAYGNGVNGVQSFYYFTKYAHNHYIQAMVETGIVGLVLFLGLLAVSAVSIWRGRKKPLAPALGAALVFMAGHCAVEVTLSHYTSMPILFSVFTVISLCCGSDFPLPAWTKRRSVQNGAALGTCALLVVTGVLLGCNAAARNIAASATELGQLEQAARLDPFESADHMLSYVVRVTGTDPDAETRQKADEYAARLAKRDSNSIPIYLAEYYLETGRIELGLEQAERYVSYVSSDSTVWQKTFELLERYEQDTPEYRAGVARIADLLDAWNEENLGHIGLDEQCQLFIDRMRT